MEKSQRAEFTLQEVQYLRFELSNEGSYSSCREINLGHLKAYSLPLPVVKDLSIDA